MLDYILKMKTIYDNLAAVGEPVKDRDHILQLLGGLGPDYNSIVASLTAREDDLSLHSVHSILLTHEQRLHLQHSSPTDLPFASMASVPSRQPSRPHQPRHYHHQSRPQHQVSSSSNRPPTRFHPQQPRNHYPIPSTHNKPHHLSTRLQCQLCASSVIRLSNAITVLTSIIKATMVFHLHRLLFLMPCLLPHQIIKILGSLTLVQLTTLVILLKLSLVFSHIQVLIKSQLVMAIRYPFLTQVPSHSSSLPRPFP